jgi:hypothetical protein
MGLVWPLMRELRETEYQFRSDFVMDSSAAQAMFGLDPTPWEEIVAVTAAAPRACQLVQLADCGASGRRELWPALVASLPPAEG